MKNNSWTATEYPEDIAGALTYKLYRNPVDNDRADEIEKDLINAIEYLKACAENPHNMEGFRALYTALEDMKNEIEDEIPWWDKE